MAVKITTVLLVACLALLANYGTEAKATNSLDSADEARFMDELFGLLGGLGGGGDFGGYGPGWALISLGNVQSKLDTVLVQIQSLPNPAAAAGR